MTRDLDEKIARLNRHRAWAERSVAQFHKNGSHEYAEELRLDYARIEKTFERMVMRAADAESDGKWH